MDIEDIITLYEYFKEYEDRYDDMCRNNDRVLSAIIDDLKLIKDKLGIEEELPF